jgi:diguanylate cyclase (GGDEF)-like protein
MVYEDPSALLEIASRILEAMHQPLLVGAQQIDMSVSIGICTYPADASDPQALVSNADVAMYSAKAQGRDRFAFYSASMDKAALLLAQPTKSLS